MDFQKLDVFRTAVELRRWVAKHAKHTPTSLHDQLERASDSVVLNLGEGAGKRAAKEKAHAYAIARGSVTECAAVISLLGACGRITTADHDEAQELASRVAMMLSRLIARYSAP